MDYYRPHTFKATASTLYLLTSQMRPNQFSGAVAGCMPEFIEMMQVVLRGRSGTVQFDRDSNVCLDKPMESTGQQTSLVHSFVHIQLYISR